MSHRVRIVARARADVDSIFSWLLRRSVRGAISWYLAFGRAVQKIAASPDAFAETPEAGPLGRDLRQILFKTARGRIYRIVFQYSSTEIQILRVRGPGQPRLRQRDLPRE
jgi:plasmid stabilization system protein ParE